MSYVNAGYWNDGYVFDDPIAGAAQSSADATAGLSVTESVAGVAQSSADAAAGLSATESLAGAAQSSADATAGLSVTESLAGAAQSSADATAGLSVTESIAGVAQSSADAAGGLSATESLAGAAQSSADAIAGLSVTESLAGAAQSSTDATAGLSVTESIAGAAQSSADATAGLSATESIAGVAQSSADAAAGLSATESLAGAAQSSADAAAGLSVTESLAGAAQSSADATAGLSITESIAGVAQSSADAAGGLTKSIAGAAQAASNAEGTLLIVDRSAIHKLTPPALIDLYSVDLNSIGVGEVYYFYDGTDTDSTPLIYQGNTYTPWYVKVTGLDKRGTGSSARPNAEIGNAARFVTDLCRTHQDMVGATVRRRRTLASYVQANIGEYHDEYYLIERRAEETELMVKFELASPLDFLDKQLPGLLALATGCPHRYKSTEGGSGCSWPGTNPSRWFDRFGTPVLSVGLDVCGKRLSDCKLRFGATEPLDYGGNPGLGRSSV